MHSASKLLHSVLSSATSAEAGAPMQGPLPPVVAHHAPSPTTSTTRVPQTLLCKRRTAPATATAAAPALVANTDGTHVQERGHDIQGDVHPGTFPSLAASILACMRQLKKQVKQTGCAALLLMPLLLCHCNADLFFCLHCCHRGSPWDDCIAASIHSLTIDRIDVASLVLLQALTSGGLGRRGVGTENAVKT